MSFQQFPVRFGKFIILDRISAGGMAEVYRAKEMRDNGISPVIAIKRMLPGIASEAAFAPMFVDEAKLASRLSHANIAQTLELGRVGDSLYIAMEMVWGRDFKSIMKTCAKRKLQVPVSFACYVVAKAAEALDFAHNARGPDGKPLNLVHRDVSPHNLMIDYEGDVKVIDFGVAKAEVSSAQTVHGTIKGKFSYMAPEQVTGAPVDGRTDIFGLGIVLYEALSGERLYDGSSAFSIYEKVVNQPAPRLADVMPGVPPELDAIVAKCLQKKREDRYDNASQLAEALSAFLIQDRTIIGQREAAKLLRDLFPGDEAEIREKKQRYAAMTERDCVDSRNDVIAASENAQTRVFAQSKMPPTVLQTALAPGGEAVTPPARAALQARATDEIDKARPRRTFAIAVGMLALGIAAAGVIIYQSMRQPPSEVSIVPPMPLPPTPMITATELPKVPAVGSSFSLSVPEPAPDPEPAPPEEPNQPVHKPTPHAKQKTGRPDATHPSASHTKAAPAASSTGDFGFISVGSRGAATAKVFVDGHEVGYAPLLAYKVKVGKHMVKVVPIKDEMPGVPSVQNVDVTKDNGQGSPRRVFADFQ